MSARLQSFLLEPDGGAVLFFEGNPGPDLSLRLKAHELAGMAEASAGHVHPHEPCHCQGPLDVCCSPVHDKRPRRKPSSIEQQCLTLDYAHAPHTWVSVHGDRLCHGVTVKAALHEVLEAKATTERRIRVLVEAEGPYTGPSEKFDAERKIRAWLGSGGLE